jgi:hypothetical protein
MENKRGMEKYYIIISLILGLMVLSLSLFFIFNEYFTEDELDWYQCRQSIILRSSLPEADLALLATDTKGAFPLKCRTEVVEIDSAEEPEEVYGKIADAVAEGWYMFGEGEFDFVHRDEWRQESVCMVFARIDYSQGAVDDFNENNLEWFDVYEKWGSYENAFFNFYKDEELSNTDSTYDDYLSVYAGDFSINGNLMIDWQNVRFFPDSKNDYLLVYKINKASGLQTSSFANVIADFVLLDTDFFISNEEIKLWESTKGIFLTTPGNLDSVGCDKFLTIPA